MKRRFAAYICFGALIPLVMILSATCVQVMLSGGDSWQDWMRAQQTTPLLWLLDLTALGLGVFVFYAGAQVTRHDAQSHAYAELAQQQIHLQEEQQRQVEAMIARSVQMEKQNADLEQASQERLATIAALEENIAAMRQDYEAEARRLTDEAFHALQTQVETHTRRLETHTRQIDKHARQMEAINLAMQHQRAEVKELRQHAKARKPETDPLAAARLTPDELSAISEIGSLFSQGTAGFSGLPETEAAQGTAPQPLFSQPASADGRDPAAQEAASTRLPPIMPESELRALWNSDPVPVSGPPFLSLMRHDKDSEEDSAAPDPAGHPVQEVTETDLFLPEPAPAAVAPEGAGAMRPQPEMQPEAAPEQPAEPPVNHWKIRL